MTGIPTRYSVLCLNDRVYNHAESFPTFTINGLLVPVPIASALMIFACRDQLRETMSGLGLDECHLAATDGHTAARILGCTPNGQDPASYNGSAWPGAYVSEAIKIAKAHKESVLLLEWSARIDSGGLPAFPPLDACIPKKREVKSRVGLNVDYLARVKPVAEAVQGKGRNAPLCGNNCEITSIGGPTDPVVIEIPAYTGPSVEVVIMPMRI